MAVLVVAVSGLVAVTAWLLTRIDGASPAGALVTAGAAFVTTLALAVVLIDRTRGR